MNKQNNELTPDRTGRTTHVKHSIAYGMLQVLLSLILPFAVRTVVIYRFGVEYLGLNTLFSSVIGVLSLAELGFGTALVFQMYKPAATGNVEELCACLSFYRWVYRIIGLVILTLGLLLLPILPLLVKGGQLPSGLNLYLCYGIFLTDGVLSHLLFGYLESLPIAFQRRDVLSGISSIAAVLKSALQCAILLVSDNFYCYLLAIPAVTVFRNLLAAYRIRRMYPMISCRGTLPPETKRGILRRTGGLFLNKLFAVSRNGIDSVCISSLIGLTMAGIYSNYFYIFSGVVMLSGVVTSSMIPSVGNSIATDSPNKTYTDLRRFDFLYTAIAGWATTCLLCLFQPFMQLWVGPSLMMGMPEVFALCFYFYLLKSGDIRWVYHEGAGLWWEAHMVSVAEAVANIVLNIVFCRIWGISGVIIATDISLFLFNFLPCPWILFRCYFKNGALGQYFTDHLLYFLSVLPVAGLCLFLCTKIPTVTPLTLARRLLICTVVTVCAFYLTWHRTGRYKDALQWIRGARGRWTA